MPGAGLVGPEVGVGGDPDGRLFEIIGSSTLNVNVTDVNFYGGTAVDDGGLAIPGISAVGGAFLIDGGDVVMSNVGISGAVAAGAAGGPDANGAVNDKLGQSGGPGGNGQGGGNAAGGGIFLDTGNLALINGSLAGDRALGGVGGKGGDGGDGAPTAQTYLGYRYDRHPFYGNGGNGGGGGNGGAARGGAIYVAGGALHVNNEVIGSNGAIGGGGGTGGAGGSAGRSGGGLGVFWLRCRFLEAAGEHLRRQCGTSGRRSHLHRWW